MVLRLAIAPQDPQKIKQDLADHLSALTNIRGYVIAVENTTFNPPSPKPDWFDGINAKLNTTKEHARVWNTTLEPAIVSTIPEAVIRFGTRFDMVSGDILGILSSSSYNPSRDGIQSILSELNWLKRHMSQQQASIENVQSQFTNFQNYAATDLTALTTGSATIQKAQNALKDDIDRLNADIASVQAEIKSDQAAITASAIAGGVGLFVGVAAVGLGVAFSGPFAPVAAIIGGFVIVGSIVEMAAVIATYSHKIAQARSKLNSYNSQLQADQTLALSFTTMQNSTTNLITKNQAMANSLTEIADWWKTLDTKLDTEIKALQDALQDADKENWDDVAMDMRLAKRDWQDFKSFATNMQNIATGAPTQQVRNTQRAA
ncbi:MAG: HBL/NHE enterotoxin family protein [Cyanobacteria bacterium SBLK]|nr:HBL/NHE enterotoxin family protein [Cyanobacteria bacterium SBLK]